jgi:hypothetical protein
MAAASHRVRGIAASSTAVAARGMVKASTRAKLALATENMTAARALARRHGDSVLGVLAAGPESLVLQLAGQTAQRRLTAQLAPRILSPVPTASPVTSVLKPGRLVPFVFSVFTAYNWAQRADSAWTLSSKDSWLRQVIGPGGGVPPARDNRSPAPRRGPSPTPAPSPGLTPSPVPQPKPTPPPAPQPGPAPTPPPRTEATARPTDPSRPSAGITARPVPPPATAPPSRVDPPTSSMRDIVSRPPGAERSGPGSLGTCPIPKSSPDHQKDGSAGSR